MTQQAKLKAAEAAPRDALAAAIKDHADAIASQRRVADALEHAETTVHACRAHVVTAETQLAEAQVNASRRLAAVALGEPVGISNEDAASALTQAQNDLAIAKATREALSARHQRQSDVIESTRRNVDDAVRSVIAASVPSVAELLKEATEARAKFVEYRCLLRWLMRNGFDSSSPEYEMMNDFLGHPFLLLEYGDGWSKDAILAPVGYISVPDSVGRDGAPEIFIECG